MKLTQQQIGVVLLALDTRKSKLDAWIEIARKEVTRQELDGVMSERRMRQAGEWHAEKQEIELLSAAMIDAATRKEVTI